MTFVKSLALKLFLTFLSHDTREFSAIPGQEPRFYLSLHSAWEQVGCKTYWVGRWCPQTQILSQQSIVCPEEIFLPVSPPDLEKQENVGVRALLFEVGAEVLDLLCQQECVDLEEATKTSWLRSTLMAADSCSPHDVRQPISSPWPVEETDTNIMHIFQIKAK